MMHGTLKRWLSITAVVALTAVLVACGGSDEAAQQATADAMFSQIQAEATPESAPAEATPEPDQPPTDTPADESPPEEAAPADEPDVAATESAAALSATAVAVQTAQANEAVVAQATLEPIQAELATYGVAPNDGSLAWVHPPISMEVTDFEDFDYANQRLLTVARDFVLVADVTWNSRFAESGCGFVVRSDGKEEEGVNQYIIGMTRGAEGHVLWAEQIGGEVDLNTVTDYYANGLDPLFEWQNDTTNRIAIVGRGQEFTLYSNGTRLGTIQAQSGFEEGFVAFIAINRSGGIRCDYNNAWLWRMDS